MKVLCAVAIAVAVMVLSGCAAAGPVASGSAADPASGSAFRAPVWCHSRGTGVFTLPDPHCTPGATSRAVTQSNIHSTICVRGYSRRVRPPESVTEPEKLRSMSAYGEAGSPREFEYDHLISLELGGAANDQHNLWPEPGRSPNPKDRLENRLHELVCTGRLSLGAAQRQIARNWVGLYRRVFG